MKVVTTFTDGGVDRQMTLVDSLMFKDGSVVLFDEEYRVIAQWDISGKEGYVGTELRVYEEAI